MFAPAVVLVLHGNLSVNDALLRFGCALLAAAAGTALLAYALPGQDRVDEPTALPEPAQPEAT
jgi:hypothetical protein